MVSRGSHIPSPSIPAGIGVFGALCGFLLWMALKSGIIVFWVLFAGVTALILTFVPTALSTRLTLEGVSQWTWRGRRAIRWSEVQRAELRPKGTVVITGAETTIEVHGIFFRDLDEVIDWIASRVPHMVDAPAASSPRSKGRVVATACRSMKRAHAPCGSLPPNASLELNR
jgi:hypothetical protein